MLLIVADEHGVAAAARAANGTLLGIVALSGFVLAYAWVARCFGWGVSLAAGWLCAAALTALVSWLGPGLAFPGGLAAAAVSLAAAHRLMPAAEPPRSFTAPSRGYAELPLRMAATAVLVVALATAVDTFGPLVGGALGGLPVLASVLAAFAHREDGARTAVALMRGMLVGMTGFVGFCAVVAVLVIPAGVAVAFAAATIVSVALQLGCASALSAWARDLAPPAPHVPPEASPG